jgi:CubicO group peptidase (beta-lactamase class C family)
MLKQAIMSQKLKSVCLKGITTLVFMLFFQLAFSQYNFKKVDSWLEDNLKDLGGRAVLMVYKDGKIVYQNDENHLSKKQKMIGKFITKRKGIDVDQSDFTPQTRLRIASCSKWLSAALVMTFVDEGKLSVDDTIGKYLPIFTQHGKGAIKVSDCLSHLSGIKQAELKQEIQSMQQLKSMDEAIEKLANQPMEGTPGKTFHYGNAGLQICGAIVEKIGKKDFETLFAERIAKPLGMNNTDFGKKEVPLPAGGAYSTAEDYMNFLIMILNKGMFNGKRILSEKSITEMQKNRTTNAEILYTPAQKRATAYGYGEWVDEEENGISKAVSSPGLFGSIPVVDNKRNYCYFLMVLNVKYQGRQERYVELKKIMDAALGF